MPDPLLPCRFSAPNARRQPRRVPTLRLRSPVSRRHTPSAVRRGSAAGGLDYRASWQWEHTHITFWPVQNRAQLLRARKRKVALRKACAHWFNAASTVIWARGWVQECQLGVAILLPCLLRALEPRMVGWLTCEGCAEARVHGFEVLLRFRQIVTGRQVKIALRLRWMGCRPGFQHGRGERQAKNNNH